jgi:Uma2 family endonuclease
VGKYLHGAPELAIEVCQSSTDHDYGPKLRLYQRVGVSEYITLDTAREQLVWRVLVGRKYQALRPDSDGILRSRVFPGLWLDPLHVWAEDVPGMESLLQQGLDTAEHQAFIERLARR